MIQSPVSPPHLFLRFFRWFCDPKIQDFIEGDLMEVYQIRLSKSGKKSADLKFIIDVLLLFRPGIIRPINRRRRSLNSTDMILNYLKVGVRNILRHKVYSSINIFGFAIGIATSLLIILYISDELSYDRFHKDADRIYRIYSTGRLQGNEFKDDVSAPPIAEALLQNVPEVQEAVRFGWWRAMPVRYKDKSFVEKRSLTADSSFFSFFSFPLISGNIKTVLSGPNKVVLTASAARLYFGDENPLGKMILRGEIRAATEVTGVCQDPPPNSHIQFDMIFSGETWPFMKIDHWSNTGLYTYIKAHTSSDASIIEKKLSVLTRKNIGPELEEIMGISMDQFEKNGNRFGFLLQPLLDIHLESDLSSNLTSHGDIKYLYIYGAIAAFILLIACVNFMNLSTARSVTRAREVGVRKSIGAIRSRLMFQFLSESVIYSILSTSLALLIVILAIEPFNNLADKKLNAALFLEPEIFMAVIGFALLTGLVAGSYPAFYLSAFKPIDVLKGKTGIGSKNSSLRNSLVVFQFIISIALMFGSMVVYRQLKYMQDKNMGFDKENIVVLNNSWSLANNKSVFRNELLGSSDIKSVTFASGLPPLITDSNIFRKGGTEQDIVLSVCTVDYDHLATMGYQMSKGRFFSSEFPSDSTAIILNETAYKQFGFDVLEGQTVINFNAEKPTALKLIGVVKDFNFENLRNPVKPMAMILNVGANTSMVRESNNLIAVRLAGGTGKETIGKLETTWKKYSSSALEFSFLDENLDAMFRSERRMSQIIFIFTMLTIVIACLGLFGLSTYLSEQRSKEISIRKVLGASVGEVIILLFRDFVLLIGIAFVIAAPGSWYLMSSWLSDFAYRIDVDLWMVITAGLLSSLIAILTVGYQSIKAATENPVNALKNE